LVWTNPGPSSPIAAGTINLDESLAGYTLVGVVVDKNMRIISLGVRTTLQGAYYWDNTANITNRVVTVNTTSFTNEGGYVNNSTQANDRLVPTAIYGIK
jgi:hypothetical protein